MTTRINESKSSSDYNCKYDGIKRVQIKSGIMKNGNATVKSNNKAWMQQKLCLES